MIMVTTKKGEKRLEKLYYKNSAINTQVKDHIPLKKQRELRNTGFVKMYQDLKKC